MKKIFIFLSMKKKSEICISCIVSLKLYLKCNTGSIVKLRVYIVISKKERDCANAFDTVPSFCDSEGILTLDLQNRNLTFYTAELRSRNLVAKLSKKKEYTILFAFFTFKF